MDKAWIKIIKVTGAVGVVGLLLSLFMNHMFNEQIVNILGSEQLFFILLLLLPLLLFSTYSRFFPILCPTRSAVSLFF